MDVNGKAPDVVYDIVRGHPVKQSIRYPIEKFKESEARAHCKDLGGRFEAAKPEKKTEDIMDNTRVIILATAPEEGKTATWAELLMPGKWYHQKYGDFEVTKLDLEDMVKNFKSSGQEIPVEFSHPKEGDDPDKKKAAGWIKDVAIGAGKKAEQVLRILVDWTEEAADFIRKKEYKYLSADFHPNKPSKETGGKPQGATLAAAGLTNRPFIEGLAPVLLSDDLDPQEFSSIASPILDKGHNKNSDPKEDEMDKEKILEFAKTAGLELDAEASDDDILKALGGKFAELEKAIQDKKELEDKDNGNRIKLDDGSEIDKEGVIELRKKVVENDESIRRLSAEKEVDALIGEQILPAHRELAIEHHMAGPEQFKKFIEPFKDGETKKLFDMIGSEVVPEEDEVKAEAEKEYKAALKLGTIDDTVTLEDFIRYEKGDIRTPGKEVKKEE